MYSSNGTGAKTGLTRGFIISAGAILALTGIAKIWSGLGHSKLLMVDDPITHIEFSNLMLIVGIVELVVAGLCFLAKIQKFALGMVAWLASNFVAYRIGLLLVDYRKPCPCLGNLTDALPISPHAAEIAMKIALAYLLIGSYALIFWLRRQERKPTLFTAKAV